MNNRLIAVSFLALLAHTPASARAASDVRPLRASASGDRDLPTGTVGIGDLNLTHPAGAAALRRRLDAAVIVLSGGHAVSNRSDVRAARVKARAQADALIDAARARSG